MQALIIGGAGFVGSYLAAHCMNNWHWKVAITKMDSESLELPGTDVYNLNTPGSHADPGNSRIRFTQTISSIWQRRVRLHYPGRSRG